MIIWKFKASHSARLGGVALLALSLDLASPAMGQVSLPPVTIEAPRAQRPSVGPASARTSSRRVTAARNTRRRPAAEVRSIPTPSSQAVETATGPVNGYVASRSASATKTDTPILETPQTISVVSREQIRDQGGQTLGEVLNYVPGVGVQASSFARVSDNISIRGFDVAAGNSGILRDGLKLTSGVYDSTMEPFGLERLEVVKGASSILFGQLGPGGLINAVSKRPTDVPFGEVNVSVGDYQRKEISADVGGKLVDDGSLLYRFTGLLRDADAPTQYVPDDKLYLAPAVTWRPNADTSLTVFGYYQEVKTRFPTPLPAVGTVVPTSVGKIPSNLFLGEPNFDRFDSKAGTVGYQFEHAFNNAVKLRQNLRLYDATTNWDYLQLGAIGADGRTASRSVSSRIERGNGFAVDTSAEFKFVAGPTAHTVIAGVDYYRSVLNSNRYTGTATSIDVFNPVYNTAVTVNRSVDRGSNTLSNQVGIYVQDQIKIYDKFVLLLGGRKDFSDVQTRVFRTSVLTTQEDDAWTGRAGAVYLFDNGVAPYASFSQSFAPVLGVDRLGNPFAPTRGEQYEAGVRYQPPGSKMLFSAAAFQITQQNVLTPDPVDITFSVQSGEVTSRGVELEAKAEVGPVSVVSSYTYTDARTTRSNNIALLGERTALVPYNAASIWGLYDFGSVGWYGFKFGGGVRFVGETNLPGSSLDVPSYVVTDLTASYDLKHLARELNGFQARLNVKNLFNKGYVVCVAASGCRYGDPQTVVATLTYRW
ncbi:TonB-dependent siderophore receptor [Rhodopseudomonas sp. NSM]|uniref:TonB-dependent siderophore receptor n=1 Tax=Rhodopseudomonas sp. NSM TaxID=3457630 RepID=UPI0040369248